MANLSIYGLTLLYNGNGSIFDELQLPTQITDSSIITNRLMLDTMELEVLYADPDIFKGALGIYSKSRLHSWQMLADDMFHAYDPFINFTRDETRTIETDRDLEYKRTANLTDTKTLNLSDAETRNLANSSTKTTSRNAWNGSAPGTMVTTEQDSITGSDTGTDTMLRTGTDTDQHTGTDTNTDTGTITTTETFHSQGDSALFTPTDVAKKEWELRAQYSVIEYILADIKTHFCLMVY